MSLFAWAFLALGLPGWSGIQPENVLAVRTVLVSVRDGEGTAVSGLGAEDFQLVERGLERDIVEVTADERQTEILLLVDTSVAFFGEVQPLRQAVEVFVRAVSPHHLMSLYEFGGRPHLLAGPIDDAGTLLSAVGKLYARQQDASYLLDALVEAAEEREEAEREEGNPLVVVIVSGMGPEFSHNHYERAKEVGERSGAVYHAVVYDSPRVTRDFIRRSEIEGTLTHLTQKTDGTFTRVLTATGIENELDRLAAEFRPGYRVSFLTELTPKSDPKEISILVREQGARVELIRLLSEEKKVPAER